MVQPAGASAGAVTGDRRARHLWAQPRARSAHLGHDDLDAASPLGPPYLPCAHEYASVARGAAGPERLRRGPAVARLRIAAPDVARLRVPDDRRVPALVRALRHP